MTGQDFDLIDFFICELEDVILDGMTVTVVIRLLIGSVGFWLS